MRLHEIASIVCAGFPGLGCLPVDLDPWSFTNAVDMSAAPNLTEVPWIGVMRGVLPAPFAVSAPAEFTTTAMCSQWVHAEIHSEGAVQAVARVTGDGSGSCRIDWPSANFTFEDGPADEPWEHLADRMRKFRERQMASVYDALFFLGDVANSTGANAALLGAQANEIVIKRKGSFYVPDLNSRIRLRGRDYVHEIAFPMGPLPPFIGAEAGCALPAEYEMRDLYSGEGACGGPVHANMSAVADEGFIFHRKLPTGAAQERRPQPTDEGLFYFSFKVPAIPCIFPAHTSMFLMQHPGYEKLYPREVTARSTFPVSSAVATGIINLTKFAQSFGFNLRASL